MSRTPIPPGLKILRHETVGRGEPPAVANLPRFAPTRPRGLDRYARECWVLITPILVRCRLLHGDSSLPALVATCEAYSRYKRLKIQFDRVFGTDEQMSIAQVDVADRAMRTWLNLWGLTAAHEAVLVAASEQIPDADDPFAVPSRRAAGG